MTNVAAFRVSDWDKDGTIVKVTTVTLDDGREVPGYDLPPGIEANKPLPDGWEIATSAKGKPYIKVPKAGKGGGGGFAAAFRNTKEGQAIEQERMDRRTALMQAVEAWAALPDPNPGIENYADAFYTWLRETAAPGPSTSVAAGAGGIPSSSSSPAPTTSQRGGWGEPQDGGGGQGKAPASSCTHENTSPLGPTGRAVPAGKVFCLDCRTVVKEAS